MTDLVEADLGHEGISYIAGCLRQGLGLSSRLLRLPLASGAAFAPLPGRFGRDRATSFDAGGLMRQHYCHVWLTEHLERLWREAGEGTFVVQDLWAMPTDGTAQQGTVKKFTENVGLYYFIEHGELGIERVEETIRAIASFRFVGIFATHVIRDQQLPPDRKVPPALVDKLADTTREIFVSAYDQEGFVIWRACDPIALSPASNAPSGIHSTP